MKIVTLAMAAVLCAAALIVSSGCLSWEEGWKNVKGADRKGDVRGLIAKANAEIAAANNREKVEALLRTYEQVLEIDPNNYEALWSLGRYYTLMGVGYSDSAKMGKEYLLKTVRYCERGMYTNKEFKKLVDGGSSVWDASSALTIREIEAMYYWYGAIGNIYRSCMNPVEKIFNLHWAGRTKKMRDRMMAIDPAWGGGHPYYAMAGYYAVLPAFIGGDLKKAEFYFQKAVEAGPEWLYVRFFRAVLLHQKTGDMGSFKKDLQWVIAQDPHKAKSPYPWNVYFQKEAKKMLADSK